MKFWLLVLQYLSDLLNLGSVSDGQRKGRINVPNWERSLKKFNLKYVPYIISRLIKKNVKTMVKSTMLTHEKKLCNLTQNTVLPFTSTDTVLNLSSSKLTDEEMNILRYGLKYSN